MLSKTRTMDMGYILVLWCLIKLRRNFGYSSVVSISACGVVNLFFSINLSNQRPSSLVKVQSKHTQGLEFTISQ